MLKLGHRGAAGLAPENTILGIQKAIEAKVDMIEIDVMSCKTGEVILFHDKTAERMTGQKHVIKKMTLDQIRELSVQGHKIPTLEEAIKAAGKTKLNLEMKDDESVEEVARLIKKYGLKDALVSAYSRTALKKMQELMPELLLGAVAIGINPWTLNWVVEQKIRTIVMMYSFITKSFVQSCHEHGVQLFAYPYGTKSKMNTEMLKNIGVDAAIMNYPDKGY